MRRATALFGASILFATGIIVLGTVPASASTTGETLENGTTAENCLNTNSAGQVFVSACDITQETQQWLADLVSGQPGDENEVMRIVNVGTGKCLDSEPNGGVVTSTCGSSTSQSWSGDEVLTNQASGLCASAENDGAVDAVACAAFGTAPSQEWFWGPWT